MRMQLPNWFIADLDREQMVVLREQNVEQLVRQFVRGVSEPLILAATQLRFAAVALCCCVMLRVAVCCSVCERWGAGVETQKNVRGEIGGWGRVPFNEPYAPSLSTIYDGA